MELKSYSGTVNHSSFITDVIYNDQTQELMLTLSGVPYVYSAVPSHLADELQEISKLGHSCGKFYSRYIKGQYVSRKGEISLIPSVPVVPVKAKKAPVAKASTKLKVYPALTLVR